MPFFSYRKMEAVHFVEQLLLFFNPVQFHQIERVKPQFFDWLLDYLDGGKIKRVCNTDITRQPNSDEEAAGMVR